MPCGRDVREARRRVGQVVQASCFKDYSLILAGVTVAALPLVALFAVAGRQLVAGVMQGAVKG